MVAKRFAQRYQFVANLRGKLKKGVESKSNSKLDACFYADISTIAGGKDQQLVSIINARGLSEG